MNSKSLLIYGQSEVYRRRDGSMAPEKVQVGEKESITFRERDWRDHNFHHIAIEYGGDTLMCVADNNRH